MISPFFDVFVPLIVSGYKDFLNMKSSKEGNNLIDSKIF